MKFTRVKFRDLSELLTVLLEHVLSARMKLSELPNQYANKYQSPASVAAAIDDMADAIVTKAAQKAKEAIENAACHNPETKLQSALG